MPYTITPGYENSPFEQFRAEMNIETINSETRPGIMARFQQWQAQRQIQDRYGEVTDFTSPLYQQYRKYLSSVTPTTGTNAILAPLVAGGGNYAASQVQASARVDELGKERTDFLNTNVTQFGLGMQEQAGGLLDLYSGNANAQATQAAANRQANRDFEESQAGVWDYAPLALAFASDRRLKENIEKVGTSPSGVNIYEFNYKDRETRYRGAMADENPAASIEKDGVLYLDYSKIDVNFEVI